MLSCTKEPHRSTGLPITASIHPLADVARTIGGEYVDVTVLIPPGASPHSFEPTPEQFKKFSRTDLFVMVGAGLEFWAEKLVHAAAGPGLRIVKVAEGVDLIGMVKGEHDPTQPHEPGPEPVGNPHVWLDPMVVRTLVNRLESILSELDPEHSEMYHSNADRYRAALDSLDAEIRRTVEGFEVKEFVAFHPAWVYFARRYGLTQVGVIEASPGRDPTPKQLKELVDAVRSFGIRAVFAEPQLNPTAAEALAREAGVRVLLLDPLGGPSRSTYLDLMRYNLSVMSEAMG
jgi:zinc transport system substrate-binding protein